jgi:RNA polymerase sigma-70 factor (ECF subfamily)
MNMPPTKTPDSGLLQVFLDLHGALRRYLVLRGAAPDEAEDILQEIGLKLTAHAPGPVDQPRAYLYRMATNHFLLHRRTAQRRSRREEDWVDAHSGDTREVDTAPSAETGLAARQQLALVQRLIDRLPERTRTIFRRFRLGGEPQRLIAADIGISTSAVEKHLARAYAELSEIRHRLDVEEPLPRHLMEAKDRHDR